MQNLIINQTKNAGIQYNEMPQWNSTLGRFAPRLIAMEKIHAQKLQGGLQLSI